MNSSSERAKKYEDIANEAYVSLVKESIKIREKNLLSQRDVGNQLGLNTHSSIVSVENMKTIPRLDKFLKILAVYGFTLKIVPKDKD